MCGAYAVVNNPFINAVTEALNVQTVETRSIRVPASSIQIVKEDENSRQLIDAKWWLLLQADGKPNYQYATFNSRSDKLFSSRLTKGLFQTSRCIIPASGIIEGQNKKHHYIEGKRRGLALGGLHRCYHINGEIIHTASIITCPGNPQMDTIHKKSIPLMLDVNDKELIDNWLNPKFNQPQVFSDLLTHCITQDLVASPIKSARDLSVTGEVIYLNKD